MNPFFFGEGDCRLFGALHPAGTGSTGRGVVLCPPWGLEYQNSHRALRHLADRLAVAGMDALRFDYRGTGDSAGDATHASVEAWLSDLATAVDELRAMTACTRVALVGLRLGGGLACQLSVLNPAIDRVVLWSPVTNGTRYVERLEERERKRERGRVRHHRRRSGSRDLLGSPLSSRMEQELRSIDVTRLRVPERVHALLLSTEENHADALADLSPVYQHLDFAVVPGPERWLQTVDLGSGEENRGPGFVPVGVIAHITEWLTAE